MINIILIIPGFCVKTREIGLETKVFINICQTDAIPPPKDISVQKLEKILDSEDSDFKVPMSIGEIRSEADKKGVDAKACDVAINPKFFDKIEAIPLFKSFFLAVVFEGLAHKHGLHCTDDRVILKNRKAYGTLQMHRIEQREIDEKMRRKPPNLIQRATNILDFGDEDRASLYEYMRPSKIEVLSHHGAPPIKPNYILYRRRDDNDTLYGEFKFPDIVSIAHAHAQIHNGSKGISDIEVVKKETIIQGSSA